MEWCRSQWFFSECPSYKTPEGERILEEAQKRLMSVLPLLAVASDVLNSERSEDLLMYTEGTEALQQLRELGMQQIAAANSDPYLLRRWLDDVGVSLGDMFGNDVPFSQRCQGILQKANELSSRIFCSEVVSQRLKKLGIKVDEEGNIDMLQVLEKGRELLTSEDGRHLLRDAQEAALNLISLLEGFVV